MRKLCLILCIWGILPMSHAVLPPPNNAISLSLGGSSATYLNAFAIENNVAALAFSKEIISLNAGNRFGISAYSNVMLAGMVNVKNTALGFSYQISPSGSFTSQKAQLAVAKQLGEKVSFGVSLNYHRYASSNVYYTTVNLITFDAGLYYRINDKLNAGFNMFNPNRTKISESPTERLAASYRLGVDYAISEDIKLYSDVIQVSTQKMDINAGIELEKGNYHFRGGFGLNQLIALGFGWNKNKLQVDVAASFHNQLGFSPSINLGYAF